MNMDQIRQLIGSRVLCGIALLVGLALAPALHTVAAAPMEPRTWQVGVGIETEDHRMQGNGFLPNQVWINVGDSVQWNVDSAEFHTITFLAKGQSRPPFNLNDPQQIAPQGGDHYDGVSYVNSGLLTHNAPHATYRLTFDTPGNYTYVCLVHGAMSAVIHIRPASTAYPFSQEQYRQQGRAQRDEYLRHGNALERQAKLLADGNASAGPQVTAGFGDGAVMLMRFYPSNIKVHVGDTVAFTNLDVEAPHTITFGPEPQGGPTALFAPYGTPNAFDGSTPLNSGFLGADPHLFGNTFSVTFTQAGTYHYICGLHDDMGMLGTVIVLPKHRPDSD